MSGVSYGAFLGMALTGTALILAFTAMLLARRSPETFIARIFLERVRIIRALKILLMGIIMMTVNVSAHVFYCFNLIRGNIYTTLSIICGSSLAISFIIFFYENIKIMAGRRKESRFE